MNFIGEEEQEGWITNRLHILTWHIHGSYLFDLVQCPHEFYLPYKAGRPEGYAGITESYPWPENVHEVAAEEIKNLEIDCIVFQSRKNYLEDQYEILSPQQRELPRIYLEHDPPREHPTDTRHLVDDPDILLVHVTPFNNLMWDSGRTPTRVIDHGVVVPSSVRYTGELERGLVIVNNLRLRGRSVWDWISLKRSGPRCRWTWWGSIRRSWAAWVRSRTRSCWIWRDITVLCSTPSATQAWGWPSVKP